MSLRVWRNLTIHSTVSVVPLPLAAFSASLCSSLSCSIFKRADIFRVASLLLFAHSFLQINHLVPLLFLIQFCIISLLQCIIQPEFQFVCMDLQCRSLARNYSFCVIIDFVYDIIPFDFFFGYTWALFSSIKISTLVSNMQISRLNLIVYKSYNCLFHLP